MGGIYIIDSIEGICCTNDLSQEHGFHDTWSGHQKGGVARPTRCWYELPRPTVDYAFCDGCIDDLELNIAYGFIAEGTLTRGPLEALDDGLTHRTQECLIGGGGQGVVLYHIGSVAHLGAECPYGTGSQNIPIELLLEEFLYSWRLPVKVYMFLLDLIC